MLEDLVLDLRFGWRGLLRQPRAAVLAVLTMGLGIGAVSALFTLAYQVLWSPLAYPGSDRIVSLAERSESGRSMPVSSPNFADWRASSGSWQAMATYNGGSTPTAVRGLDEPVRATVTSVSGAFFDVFGVPATEGRVFDSAEPLEDGTLPLVVSERFWRRHLGSRSLADMTVEIYGVRATVLGVMPASFRFPEAAEAWLAYDPTDDGTGRTAHNWRVVARQAQGVSLASAVAEMDVIGKRLVADHAGDNDAVGVVVRPLRDVLVGSARQPLYLLFGASGLLLLLACANLTSHLLARAAARREEMAVRAALGAGRRRIVRQMLAETVLLHLLGGLAGLGVAWAAIRVLVILRPTQLVRLDELAIDGTVFAFALGTALATGLLFGLLPALSSSDVMQGIGRGGRGTQGRRRGRAWDVLVASESTLALVLLLGAGLVLRSFAGLLAVDFGFDADRVLTLDLLPPPVTVDETVEDANERAEQSRNQHLDRALGAVASVPGVSHTGLISELPLGGRDSHGAMCADNFDRLESGHYRLVAGDYFQAMGIPVVSGRRLDARDRWGAAPTAVVSTSLAAQVWPGESPLGKQICSYGMDAYGEVMATVVGVVGDVRHDGPASPTEPTYYLPLAQRPLRAYAPVLVARSDRDLASMVVPVRTALAEAVGDMPAAHRTMPERLSDHLAARSFVLMLLVAFAVIAVSLAATGVYGVVAYGVSQRQREMGIRLALGARPFEVIRTVMARALTVVSIGLVAGVVVAQVLARWLGSVVADLAATDVSMMVVTALVLAAVAAAACWLPARRAARVDPTHALRAE